MRGEAESVPPQTTTTKNIEIKSTTQKDKFKFPVQKRTLNVFDKT